jgi:antitoxin component of MazEF toxin-antitoxin module
MNRSYKNKNVRKLVRIGNASLGLTLPVEMLGSLNWRDGHKVSVKQAGKSLIIKDWHKPARRKT